MVPLQDGLQGTRGELQLPDGPLEQCDELAGEVGARMYCVRFPTILGYEIAVLREAAASGRLWRRRDGRRDWLDRRGRRGCGDRRSRRRPCGPRPLLQGERGRARREGGTEDDDGGALRWRAW